MFTSEDFENFSEFNYVTRHKLSNILCSAIEVEKLLKNLNVYKSPRPDGLSPRILKECANVLSELLCFFLSTNHYQQVNCCIHKLANFTPLFKKGSKTDRNNYRQICFDIGGV